MSNRSGSSCLLHNRMQLSFLAGGQVRRAVDQIGEFMRISGVAAGRRRCL